MTLNCGGVQAAWVLRVTAGEDPVQAMAYVLFERMDDAQLDEFMRLVHDIIADDGVKDLSPASVYALAVTAAFSIAEPE